MQREKIKEKSKSNKENKHRHHTKIMRNKEPAREKSKERGIFKNHGR